MEERKTVDIAAPAQRVWDVLTDLPRWAEWMPEVVESGLAPGLTAGGAGAEYVVKQRIGTLRMKVAEFDPPRAFGLDTSQLGADFTFRYTLSELAGGITRVVCDMTMGGITGTIAGPVLRLPYAIQLEAEMRALKDRVEGTTPTA